MARIDDIFKKEIRHADTPRKRKGKFRWVHYTKLHKNKDQYCDPTTDEIERLADLIDAEGEVLQDLVIKKKGPDEYEIVAGHKRHLACKMLVEERGKKEYEFLPCYEINDSEVRSEFRVYATNGYHEKTDYEKMHEIERMRALLTEHPEEFPNVQGGRMVERLAQIMDIKKTTVGEYLTISRNLSEKGMELFKTGQLKKSAAVALAGIPGTEQDKLLDQGIITHKQIKESREARKPERKLKKPDKTDQEYLNVAAEHLIKSLWDWFLQDYMNRVQLVEKSPEEIKKKLGIDNRSWHFSTDNGIAHINLFDDYVQVWDEKGEYIGDFEWFYLAAAIQSMWNAVSLEKAQEIQESEQEEKVIPIDRGCITGKNPNGNCVCCGKDGVECCDQCNDSCNSRCGWIGKAEEEAEEERELSDLEFARKELEVAQSILWEMSGRGAAVDEKCIRSQKMLVAAYKSLIRSFERGIQLSQIK